MFFVLNLFLLMTFWTLYFLIIWCLTYFPYHLKQFTTHVSSIGTILITTVLITSFIALPLTIYAFLSQQRYPFDVLCSLPNTKSHKASQSYSCSIKVPSNLISIQRSHNTPENHFYFDSCYSISNKIIYIRFLRNH